MKTIKTLFLINILSLMGFSAYLLYASIVLQSYLSLVTSSLGLILGAYAIYLLITDL